MGQRCSRNGQRPVMSGSSIVAGISTRLGVRVPTTEPVRITDTRPNLDSFSVSAHDLPSQGEGIIQLVIVPSLADENQLGSSRAEEESERSRPVSPHEETNRRADMTFAEYFHSLSLGEVRRPSETEIVDQERPSSREEILEGNGTGEESD